LGINILDSRENLRMTTTSVSSPSVSAGLAFRSSRRFLLINKPALTLGLLTPFEISRLDFLAGESIILMPNFDYLKQKNSGCRAERRARQNLT
jgi:hypothetical protein